MSSFRTRNRIVSTVMTKKSLFLAALPNHGLGNFDEWRERKQKVVRFRANNLDSVFAAFILIRGIKHLT